MRRILLVSTCYFHNLVTSRRNILKAQVPGLDAGNKELKHLRAGILDKGNAYDDYQTNQTDKWDPWNLESGEIEKRLLSIINVMDSNSDKLIQFNELLMWTFRALHAIDVKEIGEDDFEMSDLDEDGFVEWNEFLENEFGDWDHEDDTQITLDGTDLVDLDYNRHFHRIKTRFLVCDEDNDGKLDLDEFMLFKNPFQKKEVVDSFKKICLEKVDRDKDGRISFMEYQRDWVVIVDNFELALKAADDGRIRDGNQSLGKGFLAIVDYIEHENKMFRQFFDVEKDGYLHGLDVILWLSPENSEMAYDETMALFKICDVNDDGTLDFNEIVEESDMWVDSDATEYGEQLKYSDEL